MTEDRFASTLEENYSSLKQRASGGGPSRVTIRAGSVFRQIDAVISEHLRLRWWERVCRSSTERDATMMLMAALETEGAVTLRTHRPSWKYSTKHRTDVFLILKGGIALPAVDLNRNGDRIEIKTCLVEDHNSCRDLYVRALNQLRKASPRCKAEPYDRLGAQTELRKLRGASPDSEIQFWNGADDGYLR